MDVEPVSLRKKRRAARSVVLRFFIFLQRGCVAFGILVVVLVAFLVLSGWSPLSRPVPTPEGYISSYMEYFDTSQIEKLDYVYEGSIGGAHTIGRIQFQGPVTARGALLEAGIKAGRVTLGTYDPAKMTEGDGYAFRNHWRFGRDRTTPPWLDFPFSQKLRTITEDTEGNESHPVEYKAWYIDDAHNVVYVLASWG